MAQLRGAFVRIGFWCRSVSLNEHWSNSRKVKGTCGTGSGL